MISCKGKNVLITGASMGIGKGLSLCFAREGADLALADLPHEKKRLESWAEELRETCGIKVWTFYGDLTSPDGPEKLHEEVVGAVGNVHTLVNNAGICWFGPMEDMPAERMERMILLNVLAYTKLTRFFLPEMIERNEGAILNVSSTSAFQPVPGMAVYAASKAYTQSFTEGLRLELPHKNKVVISTINPPFSRTALIEDSDIPLDFIPLVLSFMNVDDLIKKGYRGFRKGKSRFVPGILNKVMHLGIIGYLPYHLRNFMIRIFSHRLSDFLPESVVAAIVKFRSK